MKSNMIIIGLLMLLLSINQSMAQSTEACVVARQYVGNMVADPKAAIASLNILQYPSTGGYGSTALAAYNIRCSSNYIHRVTLNDQPINIQYLQNRLAGNIIEEQVTLNISMTANGRTAFVYRDLAKGIVNNAPAGDPFGPIESNSDALFTVRYETITRFIRTRQRNSEVISGPYWEAFIIESTPKRGFSGPIVITTGQISTNWNGTYGDDPIVGGGCVSESFAVQAPNTVYIQPMGPQGKQSIQVSLNLINNNPSECTALIPSVEFVPVGNIVFADQTAYNLRNGFVLRMKDMRANKYVTYYTKISLAPFNANNRSINTFLVEVQRDPIVDDPLRVGKYQGKIIYTVTYK